MIVHELLIDYISQFKTPTNIDGKECLICMEPFDIENGKRFISLPCDCSSSTYHLDCIVEWVTSGNNKNLCPHCKKTFEIPEFTQSKINNETAEFVDLADLRNRLEQNQINRRTSSRVITRTTNVSGRIIRNQRIFRRNRTVIRIPTIPIHPEHYEDNNQIISIELTDEIEPVVEIENTNQTVSNTGVESNTQNITQTTLTENQIVERINQQKNKIRSEYTIIKFIIHMVLNIITNIINIAYICNIKTTLGLKVLAFMFFLKLFSNFVFVLNSNYNLDSINMKIFLSFVSQLILIMTTTMVNKNVYDNSFILFSQIGFIVIDLIISVIISYYLSVKIENVIYDLHIIQQ